MNALNKNRILKAVRGKGQVTYKGRPIKITPDFLPETMKILDRCCTDTKRTQMPTQATIPSQTFNYHRWRNQSIPWQNQIHTLSFHKSSPSKDNNRKKQYKDRNHALEKARRQSLNKPRIRQLQEQNDFNNKNNRKQQLPFLNIS